MFSRWKKHDYHSDPSLHPKPTIGSSPPPSPRTRPIYMSHDAKGAEKKAEEFDGESVMKVGRYRGHTFMSISRNAYYIKWVRQQVYPRGALAHLRQYLDRNADWLISEHMREAMEAGGNLSTRVRKWPLDQFRERKILCSTPNVGNCTIGHTRKPRNPVYGLQDANIIPEWQHGMTKSDKWRVRCLTSLVGRFLSYVFRRRLHERRKEALSERLIADQALIVLERNDYAYRLALTLSEPENDPEGVVYLEALENELQRKRSDLEATGKDMSKLPETLRPCFSRLGCAGQGVFYVPANDTEKPKTTPRAILLRFMLSIGELKGALKTYRAIKVLPWDNIKVLEACWSMARADGAFSYDKISNETLPEALCKVKELLLYEYMATVCDRYFPKSVDVTYGPCVGFAATGCPVEADLRVGDTVWALRSGLWISNNWDFAYLQGYAALARQNGIKLNRACVVYLQHAIVLEVELSHWDHEPLLKFLQTPSKENPHKTEAEAEGNACELGLCDEPTPDDILLEDQEREKIDKKELRTKLALGHQAMGM
jgi:hypothetical protein